MTNIIYWSSVSGSHCWTRKKLSCSCDAWWGINVPVITHTGCCDERLMDTEYNLYGNRHFQLPLMNFIRTWQTQSWSGQERCNLRKKHTQIDETQANQENIFINLTTQLQTHTKQPNRRALQDTHNTTKERNMLQASAVSYILLEKEILPYCFPQFPVYMQSKAPGCSLHSTNTQRVVFAQV